jgi:hypothetical protein
VCLSVHDTQPATGHDEVSISTGDPMGLFRKLRLIRSNIANAWLMLFQSSSLEYEEARLPETGAD